MTPAFTKSLPVSPVGPQEKLTALAQSGFKHDQRPLG